MNKKSFYIYSLAHTHKEQWGVRRGELGDVIMKVTAQWKHCDVTIY